MRGQKSPSERDAMSELLDEAMRPVALVTGAARRVGAEIVRELHAVGWRVAIHYRRSGEEAKALAKSWLEL